MTDPGEPLLTAEELQALAAAMAGAAVSSRTDRPSTPSRAREYEAGMTDQRLDPVRKGELITILTRMFGHVEGVYASMQLGVQPMGAWCPRFLKHSMLMNEYAQICSDALGRGIDFALADELPVLPHRARYLLEKLVQMFGRDTFRALCASWLAELDGEDR